MPKLLLPLLILLSLTAYAQQAETLTGTFTGIKEKAQTFKDYKVIKEVTLDAFWKSVEDSLKKQRQVLAAANQEIGSLKNQITQLNVTMQQKEASVAEIIFDSEHIAVLGIPFHKALFISIFFIAVAALAALLVASITRSQLLSRSLKDKAEGLLILSSEYEEYKHRAVDKQMKLSRELQNERNKLAEIRTNR